MGKIIQNIEDKELKKKVRQVLKDAKIPVGFLGFKFLETMLIDNYGKLFSCKLYYEISDKCRTSPFRVERAIRYICESFQKQLQEHFDVDAKITNKVLYCLLVHKLEEMD